MAPPSSGAFSLPSFSETFTPAPRPDPVPAPPAIVSPPMSTGNPSDYFERYGEKYVNGVLVQTGSMPSGKSFDETSNRPSRPVSVLEEIIGPPAGTEIVCTKTQPQKCAVVPKREAPKRPDPTPSAPLNVGSSPYSGGIPSLFDSPILRQYMQSQVSRTPARKKKSSIVAPLIVGTAVVAVGIFLLTRK